MLQVPGHKKSAFAHPWESEKEDQLITSAFCKEHQQKTDSCQAFLVRMYNLAAQKYNQIH